MSELGRDHFSDPDPPVRRRRIPVQQVRWHCADGTSMRVGDMTDVHLRRALRRFTELWDEPLVVCDTFGDPDSFDCDPEAGAHRKWHQRTYAEWVRILESEQRRRRKQGIRR